MPRKIEASFGAIPCRALSDRRLTDLDIRVLGVVSSHDAMSLPSGKGEGCWAGLERISRSTNANYNNVAGSISKLEDLGYLKREVHPRDRRRSVFRVVFNWKLDQAAFKGNVSPVGEILPDDVSPAKGEITRPNGKSVSPAVSENDARSMASPSQDTGKIPFKIPSGEPASPTPIRLDDQNVGATLAQIERAMKQGRVWKRKDIDVLEGWLEPLCDGDIDNPISMHAQRIYEALPD